MIKDIGKDCKIRFAGKVIESQYIHIGDGVELEKNWVIAVYPTHGGCVNPVCDGSTKGVWLDANGSYNRNLTIYCADSIRIGKNVMFGSNCLVSDNEHGTDASSNVPYRFQRLKTKPVVIGDNCWIAENAKILSGSKIGENSVVAANAVVKGEYPPNCMLAGVPAKVIRVWDYTEGRWVRLQ